MIKRYAMAKYYEEMVKDFSDVLLKTQISAFENLISKSNGEKRAGYEAKLDVLMREHRKRNGNTPRSL